ncbi:MAG: class I SAM-dependent methyltransferase, partial [bacterium]|nr:class I SAM-dependent methyltransferase [bacterium]
MEKNIKDITGKAYWDSFYGAKEGTGPSAVIDFSRYENRVVKWILENEINRSVPSSVLEIGSGNSLWLTWIGKDFDVKVAGLDYSEAGCRLLQQRFQQFGVEGSVYCGDLLSKENLCGEQYDLVYSLGVVEHFDDISGAIEAHLKYVKPGGSLLLTIPNLRAVQGCMAKLWKPQILEMHNIISARALKDIFRSLQLQHIQSLYAGLFGFNLLAWNVPPRWPRLEKYYNKITYYTHRFLDKRSVYWGI